MVVDIDKYQEKTKKGTYLADSEWDREDACR